VILGEFMFVGLYQIPLIGGVNGLARVTAMTV
jgi:hypothetical protein